MIASIDLSTDLVMVGMLDSLSLKNTKLGLETLELMGYDPDHIRLVLNRAHSRVGISTSDVGNVLGREPDVLVPSDREIPRSVNEGVPIVTSQPQSDAAVAFRQLAAFYTGAEIPEPVAAQPHRAAAESSEGESRWSSTSVSRPRGPWRPPSSSRTPS